MIGDTGRTTVDNRNDAQFSGYQEDCIKALRQRIRELEAEVDFNSKLLAEFRQIIDSKGVTE